MNRDVRAFDPSNYESVWTGRRGDYVCVDVRRNVPTNAKPEPEAGVEQPVLPSVPAQITGSAAVALDVVILGYLATRSEMNLSELMKKTGLPSARLKYRLERLCRSGRVQNLSRIGRGRPVSGIPGRYALVQR